MTKKRFSRRQYLRGSLDLKNNVKIRQPCIAATLEQALSQAQEILLMRCIESLEAGLSADADIFAEYATRLPRIVPGDGDRSQRAARRILVAPPILRTGHHEPFKDVTDELASLWPEELEATPMHPLYAVWFTSRLSVNS